VQRSFDVNEGGHGSTNPDGVFRHPPHVVKRHGAFVTIEPSESADRYLKIIVVTRDLKRNFKVAPAPYLYLYYKSMHAFIARHSPNTLNIMLDRYEFTIGRRRVYEISYYPNLYNVK